MADDEVYELFVGIDWGSATHVVTLVDPRGRRLAERTVPHSGAGVTELVTEIVSRASAPGRIAVALEVPRGPWVDAFLERGCHVYALNPKQLDRFRDRHTVAGAKDDRRDAFVLGDALRTDRGAFRRLHPEAPTVVQLREWTRLYEETMQEQGRLANRLREQLWRYYPQALTLCPAADEPWLWSLLEEAPTPGQGHALHSNALRAVLARHHVRRFTADVLSAALQASRLPVTAAAEAAAQAHVAMLLPRLRLALEQRRQCERRLDALLAALAAPLGAGERPQHRDVTILRSLPGLGRVVAATMLAEAGRPLAARDYQSLRTHGGIAPVTKQSGKSRLVLMRRACNGRLRAALFNWARNSIRVDAACRAHYDRLRVRHGYARALRGVADRLLRVLTALLASGQLYDPARACARAT